MVRLVQTMHLSCTDTNTVSKRTERRFHMTYLASRFAQSTKGLKQGSHCASSPRNTIECVQIDYWAYVAQTMHLSCTDTNTVSKWTERRFHMTYLASRLALSPNGTKWASTWARNIGVPSGASKTIFEPTVRLAQSVHLACSNTNAVSECTKTRFHMSHVT
jgi:hypothetical protein